MGMSQGSGAREDLPQELGRPRGFISSVFCIQSHAVGLANAARWCAFPTHGATPDLRASLVNPPLFGARHQSSAEFADHAKAGVRFPITLNAGCDM